MWGSRQRDLPGYLDLMLLGQHAEVQSRQQGLSLMHMFHRKHAMRCPLRKQDGAAAKWHSLRGWCS